MKIVESYLEKGWGDSVDNPNLSDIETAIKETIQMDHEHGAFWVGVFGDDDIEIVLEVTKSLKQILIFDSENSDPNMFKERKSQAENWKEVKENYRLLLSGHIDKIEERMNKK